jgi:adenylylsulfate kinase
MSEGGSLVIPHGIVWITGFAGAGKTTLSKAVLERLTPLHSRVIRLDGDDIREEITSHFAWGYDLAGRQSNAWLIARMAAYLARRDMLVVVATVSLYQEVRAWLRASEPGYREVYVRVKSETLQSRNVKGIYSAAQSDASVPVVGVTAHAELPVDPDLVLDNDSNCAEWDSVVTDVLRLLEPDWRRSTPSE